jgi:hypothetical protein
MFTAFRVGEWVVRFYHDLKYGVDGVPYSGISGIRLSAVEGGRMRS